MVTEIQAMAMVFDSIWGRKLLEDSGVLKGSADYHSHILCGVDDGVMTLEESLAVLDYEASLGVTDVWCTPHVMEEISNDTTFLMVKFAELKEVYMGPVKLHLAAEYMLDTLFGHRLHDRDLLVIDDDRVLVETSCVSPPLDLSDRLYELQSAGYTPLLAHPERYRYLTKEDYVCLSQMNVNFQLNLPSLLGAYGQSAKNKAEWLLENGYYICAGSDCHKLDAISNLYGKIPLSRKYLKCLRQVVCRSSDGR